MVISTKEIKIDQSELNPYTSWAVWSASEDRYVNEFFKEKLICVDDTVSFCLYIPKSRKL